ncbi:MAG: hypothetical protein U9R02_00435 [Thermodesulfobacteriota bacterium]|nr:hypothetical protein [Thermodesulfobacteriota bacterium]
MTHNYSKPTRKKLRELADLAHESELSRAYDGDLLVCRAVKLGFLSREEVPEKVAKAILSKDRILMN